MRSKDRNRSTGFGAWIAVVIFSVGLFGARANSQTVDVVDLSPKFLAFYHSAVARHLDPDARWALWKRTYDFAAVPPTPFGDSLARRLLDSAWSRYPDSLSRIRRGVAALGVSPTVELQRVIALLGCGAGTKARIVAFVGGFENNAFAYSSKDGRPTVALPIEAGDAKRSVDHEFTHAVHRSSGCANIVRGYDQSLAELVVSEGLAMRVVQALVPGQPDIYYVNGRQEWFDSAQAHQTAILRGVREHLTEAGVPVVQRFTFGNGTTGLGREGYYAGWVIVGALLQHGISFHEIATTHPDKIPALLLRGMDFLVSARSEPHRAAIIAE
ncbi:MAG: DUF2268 domain-containing putative Zn-dependent protease [Gemmatimonadaceae bacterium]